MSNTQNGAADVRHFVLKVRTGNNPTITHNVDAQEASVTYNGASLNVVFFNREWRVSDVEPVELYDRVVASFGFNEVSSYLLDTVGAKDSAAEKETDTSSADVSAFLEEIKFSQLAQDAVKEMQFEEQLDPTEFPRPVVAKSEFDLFMQQYEDNCKKAEDAYRELALNEGTAQEASERMEERPVVEAVFNVKKTVMQIVDDMAAKKTADELAQLRASLSNGLEENPEPMPLPSQQSNLGNITDMIREHLAKDPIPAIDGLYKLEVTIVDGNAVMPPTSVLGYATKFHFEPSYPRIQIGNDLVAVPEGAVISIRATKV